MDPQTARETYAPNHRRLDDAALLAPPGRPLSDLRLFVCTFATTLGGLRMGHPELTRALCAAPRGALLAVNSNFGHAAQPGYEHLLKAPRAPTRAPPTRGRERKVQGDGTCFNSAVEPVLRVDLPGVPGDKVYQMKCFPSTGETQVAGVILPDLADGDAVFGAFAAYLTALGLGEPEPGAPGRRRPVAYAGGRPTMMNYKFRVQRTTPRLLVNLRVFANYFLQLEAARAAEGAPLAAAPERFAPCALLLPPFRIRETKLPTDDVKMSFRCSVGDRAPRVNVFQEGKINILGADSEATAQRIYDYLARLFAANWADFVCLQPRRDAERRLLARAPPSPPRLTDAEVDAVFEALTGAPFVAPAPPRAPRAGWGAQEPPPREVQAVLSDLGAWGVSMGEGAEWESDGESDGEPGPWARALEDPARDEVRGDRVAHHQGDPL